MALTRATFYQDPINISAIALPKLDTKYIWEFLKDGETPGRVYGDAGFRALIPFLRGPGKIIELGGSGNYYKKFAGKQQKYEVTNISGEYSRRVDMTKMAIPDNSVDAFVSMFALEHVYNFRKVIDECFRCLKPKGRILLAVPFLYYYHGAPEDYFRFTHSALDRLLSRFNILKSISFGNREMAVSQYYFEKPVLGSKSKALMRIILRLLSLPFLVAGIFGNQHDSVFAITQIYLCEKP